MSRFLIGFADTEGMPNNSRCRSSLWNLYIMFRYIVDTRGEGAPVVTKTLHSTHLSIEQRCDEDEVKKPLKCHMSSLDYLKYANNVDELLVCFWNAPHDRRVIRHYEVPESFKYIDLLPWARRFRYKHDPPIDSFSLKNLTMRFSEGDLTGEHSWNKAHTSLGDVLTMMDMLPRVSKINDEYSLILSILDIKNPYVKKAGELRKEVDVNKQSPNSKSKSKNKSKNVTKKSSRPTRHTKRRPRETKDETSRSDDDSGYTTANERSECDTVGDPPGDTVGGTVATAATILASKLAAQCSI